MIALLCAHNSVNCHDVICLPIMYTFWRDTSSELWIPILFSYIAYNHFIDFHHHFLAGHISLSSYFTLAHLILCVRQTGEIDNLFVFVGAKYLFVIVCRSMSIIVNDAVGTSLSLHQVLLDLTTLVL